MMCLPIAPAIEVELQWSESVDEQLGEPVTMAGGLIGLVFKRDPDVGLVLGDVGIVWPPRPDHPFHLLLPRLVGESVAAVVTPLCASDQEDSSTTIQVDQSDLVIDCQAVWQELVDARRSGVLKSGPNPTSSLPMASQPWVNAEDLDELRRVILGE